jgi:predicted enzyme related to lactoylglutathione lyase
MEDKTTSRRSFHRHNYGHRIKGSITPVTLFELRQLDKVIFFEIPGDNLARARKFYSTVFGWKMNEIPEMHYTQVGTVDSDGLGVRGKPKEPGAINGGMVERHASVKSPVIYISVKNIDQAAATIEQNGGKVIQPKTPVGNFGFAAYFRDTESNIVGLWQFA